MPFERAMTMYSSFITVVLFLLTGQSIQYTAGVTDSLFDDATLNIDPIDAVFRAGEDASFTCSNHENVTFKWKFNGKDSVPFHEIHGIRSQSQSDTPFAYFSKLTLFDVNKNMSGEITCYTEENPNVKATSYLVVHGVQLGGRCVKDRDCIAVYSTCHDKICQCMTDFSLKLSQNGKQACHKTVFRVLDSCENTNQCYKFDKKSICSDEGYCVCIAGATLIDGKCASIHETYSKRHQDMYRVGLVAITCLIIIVVTVSLWITLRKSCDNQSVESQLAMIAQNMNQNSAVVNIPDDKPPSYDDALQTGHNVNSPPNFIDALRSSTAARKLLRQVSAPAGELVAKNTNPSYQPDSATNGSKSTGL